MNRMHTSASHLASRRAAAYALAALAMLVLVSLAAQHAEAVSVGNSGTQVQFIPHGGSQTSCSRITPFQNCPVADPSLCQSGTTCTETPASPCPEYTCTPTGIVQQSPTLTIQSGTVQQGSTDLISAIGNPPSHKVEILVDYVVVATSTPPGTLYYTFPSTESPGVHSIRVQDLNNGQTATGTITVLAPAPPPTQYYSCNVCYNLVEGKSCPASCQYLTYGTGYCPISQFSCQATPVTPANQCGLLPPGLAHNVSMDAPWYCPINAQLYNAWKGDLPIAMLVVLIAFLIAASIFAVGTGFKNDRIRNYGIGEMYEAVASAIIVGLFLYVSAVVFGLVPSQIIGPINPYATSLHLITNTISAAENVFTTLYTKYYLFQYLSNVGVSIEIPVAGNLGQTLSGLILGPVQLYWDILVIEPSTVLMSFMTDGILALYGEYFLITFFSVAAIPVLLIPGIIFRAIIPTRAFGGMMIALALGFYLIMPTLFSVAYYFTAPGVTTALNAETLQLTRFATNGNAYTSAVNPSSPLVTQINGVESTMDSFWLLILFYPTLIIAVTYAFVVQVADIIGGASRSGGRMRAGFI